MSKKRLFMRDSTGGVAYLADQIDKELAARIFCLSIPQRRALSDISASILSCRSVNTTEISNILPRSTDEESRYRYINRFLKNDLIMPTKVMASLASEVIGLSTKKHKTAVIMMD
jgi:hypothetical protein